MGHIKVDDNIVENGGFCKKYTTLTLPVVSGQIGLKCIPLKVFCAIWMMHLREDVNVARC